MSQRKSSQLTLKNKWIVITRPIHQAKAIKKRLESAGANIILFPLLEIVEPENIGLAKQQLAQIEMFDLIIFVSPNAVKQSLKWLDKSKLINIKNKIATIGKKTAAALDEYGISADICPDKPFNSEAFLALPQIKAIGSSASQIKKIVIIKGESGRNLLYDSLIKQGAHVEKIDTYKRSCPQQDSSILKQHWLRGELDMILLTSSTSIINLFDLTENEDWFNQVHLLVGSQRMKKSVPDSFEGNLLIAEDPSDETLFETLMNPDNQK